jgi:hypothetical protein
MSNSTNKGQTMNKNDFIPRLTLSFVPYKMPKSRFNQVFARAWKETLAYNVNLFGQKATSKTYDPHGTKKPAAYAEMVREYVEEGKLSEEALDWTIPARFGGGRNCRKGEA